MNQSGPCSTAQDLRQMGITPHEFDKIKRAKNRNEDKQSWLDLNVDLRGCKVKEFLLGDATPENEPKCRNRVIQPWKKVSERTLSDECVREWTEQFSPPNLSYLSWKLPSTHEILLSQKITYALVEPLKITTNAHLVLDGQGELGVAVNASDADVASLSSEQISKTQLDPNKLTNDLGMSKKTTYNLKVQEHVKTTQAVYECRVGITGGLTLLYESEDATASCTVHDSLLEDFSDHYVSAWITRTMRCSTLDVKFEFKQIDAAANNAASKGATLSKSPQTQNDSTGKKGDNIRETVTEKKGWFGL